MTHVPSRTIEVLRAALARVDDNDEARKIVEARDCVYERFQMVFRREHIPELTANEFKAFLEFKNNQHWSGLHRQGSRICADMDALREGLLTLLDEERPVAQRLDETLERVRGMGPAIATAILHVTHPTRYGVWNRTSQAAMHTMGIWPQFPRGASVGEQYECINQILVALADEVGTDLWMLDTLWWLSDRVVGDEDIEPTSCDDRQLTQHTFGLEHQLHTFLLENWDRLDLAKHWEIYSEPGAKTLGSEYTTGIGRIDLLARSRDKSGWLVIELKRGRSSDVVVGQVLRYMGWVKRHLAAPDDSIRGLIISHDVDEKLRYALEVVPNVELRMYEVDFQLKPVA